jgi:hypothetical protein
MCPRTNDKYNLSYSRNHHSRKSKLLTWFFCFVWFSFFAFWGAENHVFHILPIRSRSYELKSLVCLEDSNSVSNWNKRWNLFYASSIFQICQMEIPVFITKFMLIICIFSLFFGKLGKLLTFMCSALIDKYKFHSRGPNTQEIVSYLLIFTFRLLFFFRILISWNHLFHIAPFHSSSYVLMILVCLEVSNRVWNWNEGKKLIFVDSIPQVFQLEIPISYTNLFLWTHYESEFHMGSVYLIV